MAQYRELSPGPRLRDVAECFWISQSGAMEAAQRVCPDGCADIIYTRTGSGSLLRFVGPMTRFEDFAQPRQSFSLGFRFRPASWSAAVPEGQADRVLPLESFWGGRATALLRSLDSAANAADSIALLSAAMPSLPSPSPVERAIAALEQSHGLLPLPHLASECNFSERQFRRRCLQITALPPKLLARILRFRRARNLLEQSTNAADIAVTCGYADQSHMIAEVREFSGFTPRQIIRLPR